MFRGMIIAHTGGQFTVMVKNSDGRTDTYTIDDDILPADASETDWVEFDTSGGLVTECNKIDEDK